jgi:hypothetical protein
MAAGNRPCWAYWDQAKTEELSLLLSLSGTCNAVRPMQSGIVTFCADGGDLIPTRFLRRV